jgi:hypothetical protein
VVVGAVLRHDGQVARRPDLNGLRLQQYGEPHVYLIDEGRRRLIPSAKVMSRLFNLGADWIYEYHPEVSSVILDLHVNKIDAGLDMPEECGLFLANDSPQVFLLDWDENKTPIKRWITSEEAMQRYQFDWDKIKDWDVSLDDLDLPDGPDISWP